jgi:hypothetical protein
MTTPGVLVESTAVTPVNAAQPVLVRVTFSELQSVRSMMPLPVVTVDELTEGLGRQLWVENSLAPKGLASRRMDTNPFAAERSDSFPLASPCFDRLAGTK